MKLLLDEMHAPAVATALSEAGMEVLSVATTPALRGAPDERLLRNAAGIGYAIVTENVRDFALFHATWTASYQRHAGLIFTSPKRFNRATVAYPGSLVTALISFAKTAPGQSDNWVWWLE